MPTPSPRSGDLVKGTVLTTGLVTSLLAPWVAFAIHGIEHRLNIDLGAGYQDQVLVGIATGLSFLAAHLRMRHILTTEQPPPPMPAKWEP